MNIKRLLITKSLTDGYCFNVYWVADGEDCFGNGTAPTFEQAYDAAMECIADDEAEAE